MFSQSAFGENMLILDKRSALKYGTRGNIILESNSSRKTMCMSSMVSK